MSGLEKWICEDCGVSRGVSQIGDGPRLCGACFWRQWDEDMRRIIETLKHFGAPRVDGKERTP